MEDEVARSRKLETFRTMPAFFVHDRTNFAAALNLMPQGLPAILTTRVS